MPVTFHARFPIGSAFRQKSVPDAREKKTLVLRVVKPELVLAVHHREVSALKELTIILTC